MFLFFVDNILSLSTCLYYLFSGEFLAFRKFFDRFNAHDLQSCIQVYGTNAFWAACDLFLQYLERPLGKKNCHITIVEVLYPDINILTHGYYFQCSTHTHTHMPYLLNYCSFLFALIQQNKKKTSALECNRVAIKH